MLARGGPNALCLLVNLGHLLLDIELMVTRHKGVGIKDIKNQLEQTSVARCNNVCEDQVPTGSRVMIGNGL